MVLVLSSSTKRGQHTFIRFQKALTMVFQYPLLTDHFVGSKHSIQARIWQLCF